MTEGKPRHAGRLLDVHDEIVDDRAKTGGASTVLR
jgi:hypothetical protein